ncbi:hypothetical protein N7520_005930 [Penicillium odoratum]|uniref:uncharacterized protein n=1 Tax=Penicillium odoratum TaxID=1167516 RepID=UPI0025499054|nr:uncharacterized protein N7520_005930 [Penicillium odoratum]KAJ5758774.1 hypothetical protein N7520_005930 [Penicillium odoratum]
MGSPRRGLLLLPFECIQSILDHLDNVASLRSAIVSLSSFYHAFRGARNLILRSVLSNLISPDLLPEACAILRASKVRIWYSELGAQNLENFRQRLVHTEFSWQDAASIKEFYLSAKFFTADFISNALSKHPLKDEVKIRKSAPVTSIEWNRVLRSFYWWEWYTISCGNNWKSTVRYFQSLEHLKIFSIWEQEQLVCVGECLFHKIAKPFNEVAAHDIKWGASEVDYNASEVWDVQWPRRAMGFLITIIGTPWAPESDNGPLEAWKWTHQKLPYEHFVQSPKLRWLRIRGYVMWHFDRLSSWGFLGLQRNHFSVDMIELSSDQMEEWYQEMERSWQKRKELYEQGETGPLETESCCAAHRL